MSSTKASPFDPIAPAWMTRRTASPTVMKNLVTSGCVTVTGSPSGDLSLERSQDRPAASQDVAETHTQASGFGLRVEPTGESLGEALGVPENADRVRGLVGGDIDETLHAGSRGRLQDVPRPHTLVFTASEGWLSSSGRCLRAGRVEDHLRPVLREYGGQPLPVADVRDYQVVVVQEGPAV